jgi:RNA polymerase sigma factor (sigma-70 family)
MTESDNAAGYAIPTPMTDPEQERKRQKFGEFYNRHLDKLIGYFMFRTDADAQVVSALAQEVFCDLWVKVPHLPDMDKDEALRILYGFARKERVQYYRNSDRQKDWEIDDFDCYEIAVIDDVESQIDQQYLQRGIEQAVSSLTDKQQDLFQQKLIERKKEEVIAHKLRIPVGTVKSRTSKVREILQMRLKSLRHD